MPVLRWSFWLRAALHLTRENIALFIRAMFSKITVVTFYKGKTVYYIEIFNCLSHQGLSEN